METGTRGSAGLVLEIDAEVRARIDRAVASGIDRGEAAAALMNSAVLYVARHEGDDAAARLAERILLKAWRRLKR